MAGSPGLPATAHVALGLVSARPRAGYGLVAYAERPIASFVPLTSSHIYAELEHLGPLGLLKRRRPCSRDAPATAPAEETLTACIGG